MSRPCTQDSRAPGGPRSGPGGASCSLTRAGSPGGSKARDTNSTTACPGASLTLGGGWVSARPVTSKCHRAAPRQSYQAKDGAGEMAPGPGRSCLPAGVCSQGPSPAAPEKDDAGSRGLAGPATRPPRRLGWGRGMAGSQLWKPSDGGRRGRRPSRGGSSQEGEGKGSRVPPQGPLPSALRAEAVGLRQNRLPENTGPVTLGSGPARAQGRLPFPRGCGGPGRLPGGRPEHVGTRPRPAPRPPRPGPQDRRWAPGQRPAVPAHPARRLHRPREGEGGQGVNAGGAAERAPHGLQGPVRRGTRP